MDITKEAQRIKNFLWTPNGRKRRNFLLRAKFLSNGRGKKLEKEIIVGN